nr:NTP transferase domain-containing protein [Bacteroidota bacterium]
MKGHQKHASLTKSIPGFFGKTEISILGTPCGNIQELAFKIIKNHAQHYKISYVDADHKGVENDINKNSSALAFGASMEYIDKIDFQRIDYKKRFNEYQLKSQFIDHDLVLVNGNHYEAKNQIVVIDPAKPLEKKLHKLTNILAFVLKESQDIPECIKDHYPHYGSLPVFHWNENKKLFSIVQEFVEENIPEIKGLVLAGGKSTRMNQDKSLIHYYNKSQIEHTHALLKPFCKDVLISCPAEQKEKVPAEFNVIEDSFLDLGPFGAILSAFKKNPDAALLVVACDLPLLNASTLNFLVSNRKASCIATAFMDPQNEFPEPLITIWEPKSYFKLLYFLG